MIEPNTREPIYGIDYGKIIKPRSELNAELEKIVEAEFYIPCEVEISAEVLKWSEKLPEFNHITLIVEAKYMMQFQRIEFNEFVEKHGFVNLKYVSKEEYFPYVP